MCQQMCCRLLLALYLSGECGGGVGSCELASLGGGGEQMCCDYLLALHLSVEHVGLLSAALKTAADVSDACMPHDTTLVPILGFLGKGMSPIAPHRLPQARKHASCLCILWLLACADHIGGISQASAFTQCEVRTSATNLARSGAAFTLSYVHVAKQQCLLDTMNCSVHSSLCSCDVAASWQSPSGAAVAGVLHSA
jgi:hypothetical protein